MNPSNGKKTQILFEDMKNTDPRTGVEAVSQRNFRVWADKGMQEVIAAVEGVKHVFVYQETEYVVYIDPRYDFEFIKREVEAALICAVGVDGADEVQG